MGRRLYAILLSLGLTGLGFASTASGDPVLMSAEWANRVCAAWNQEPGLTEKLAASGWAGNDGDRGYKIMHVYRTDCERSPRVEMRIAASGGEARCVYGGPAQGEALDFAVDYLMHAETERWLEMGAGDYGPMVAMMFRRLRFEGPKWEAMKNMGPFAKFLRLTGAVPADAAACP